MSNELTLYEREKLEYWLKSKNSLRKIAKIIRKNHTVISREIKRNSSGRKKYKASTAQRLCDERKHASKKGKLDKCPELKKYVEERINDDWSPEQIAGRLKEVPPEELEGLTISHESVYYWIYEKSEKHKKLYKHLRTNRPKRKNIGKRKAQKQGIPSRVSISERPSEVEEKHRIGDWESDTVEFRRKRNNPYISVQYERKGQLLRMHKVKNKTAEETTNAIMKTIDTLPGYMFKTMTFDNGKEGAKHYELNDIFGIETYFCDPFCSWQKGGVENMNKLIRQYLPRDIDMSKITDEEIFEIQERINNRPRKGLNYLTPNEFIEKSGAFKT